MWLRLNYIIITPNFMKYIFYCIAFFSIFTCEDDIQSSSPTLQGLRNGDEMWRSTARNATIQSNGVLSISGSDGYASIIISLPNAMEGVFNLGDGALSTITYTEGNTTYSTQNNGQEYPAYLGDGQVTIESINVENKTMRGTFYFNSYDDSGAKYMNFSQGVFFNLSYSE